MQMEMYNAPGQEYADVYMFQGNGMTGFTGQYPQDLDQFGAMYREGATDFLVDQSMYYPPPSNYGYVCTGLESPGDWDDHQMVFGMDGHDVHYAGMDSENPQYVYYTPNVSYAQTPYNPYNPYIPGAVYGVDGSFMGAQQYYSLPSYENQSSSPLYFPMNVQSRSDINNAHNTNHSFVDTISSNAYRADGPNLKHNLSSASPAFNMTPCLSAPNQMNSYRRASGGNSAVASMRSMAKGSATSSDFLFHPASTPNIHNRSAQGVENVSHGKSLSVRTQSKAGLSNGNGFSNFRPSSTHALSIADKVQSKFTFGKVHNETKMSVDKPREQNQSPKIDISGNKLTVKAFTSRAGNADAQGNITINLDQYGRNDFLIDYPNAKFFIIKSYSEDDVHKSIKYNVWSSTPNGNKKLNNAYEDIQRIIETSGSCPVFLFFSVNASGQFCGVAEMTGSVDFHKDMDFWQQDKWSGSFPVKWHVVKDVPNFNFRHIILENNDNKPVTNSRDTQEVPYNKGMEMLKIVRSYISKTSLLDDFLYYENRQRILQEEKTRLLKNHNSPFFAPVQDPPRKHISIPEKPDDSTSSNTLDQTIAAASADVDLNGNVDKCIEDASATEDVMVVPNEEAKTVESLKVGSLTISSSTHSRSTGPLDEDAKNFDGLAVSEYASNDVLTVVGSIPVKVKKGYEEEPSGFLTVGTIQLYPRPSQDTMEGGSVKRVARKG